MRRSLLILLTLVGAFTLIDPISGQSAQPQAQNARAPFVEDNAPDGKAQVYVYRPGSRWLSDYNRILIFTNEPVGILSVSKYLSFTASEGETRLWFTGASSATLAIDAVAGQTYYVKAYSAHGSIGASSASLTLMPRETALKEIADCDAETE